MSEIEVGKHSINLLQPELIPEKPLWSLKRVILVWLGLLLLMMAWAFFSDYQLSQSEKKYQRISAEKSTLNEQLVSLEQEIALHKPSNKLKEKIDLLKLVLANKSRLHEELTDTTNTQVAGFAQSMSELSENHNRGISLQLVRISKEDMAFKGLTKSPELVPAWLTGFEKSTFLSGKKFVNFTLQENEDEQLEFIVSSAKALEDFNNE
jgi:hypothetical protein